MNLVLVLVVGLLVEVRMVVMKAEEGGVGVVGVLGVGDDGAGLLTRRPSGHTAHRPLLPQQVRRACIRRAPRGVTAHTRLHLHGPAPAALAGGPPKFTKPLKLLK